MLKNHTKKRWPIFKYKLKEDVRGFWLGSIILISIPYILIILLPVELKIYLLSSAIAGILLLCYYWSIMVFRDLLLKFDLISKDGADSTVFVVSFIVACALVFAVAVVFSEASAVVFVVAIVVAFGITCAFLLIYPFGVSGGSSGVVAFAVMIAYEFTLFVIFGFARDAAVAYVCVGCGLLIVYALLKYLLSLNRSIALYQTELASKEINAFKELEKSTSNLHQQIKFSIQRLITNKKWLTLGLAGRRGIGKTFMVEMIRGWFRDREHGKINNKHQLKEEAALKDARIKRVEIFIKSPTAFEEKGFLMSVFESLAQEVDFRLSRILPPIKPIQEQRILEKINHFRTRIHTIQIIILSLTMLWLTFWGLQKSGFWSSLIKEKIGAASLKQQTLISSDSLLKKWYWPDKDIFIKEQSVLKDTTEKELKGIEKRLAFMDSILSLKGRKTTYWEILRFSKAKISLDSAKRALGSEFETIKIRIDSLEKNINLSLAKLDSVRLLFGEYNKLQARFKKLQNILEPRTESPANWTLFGYLSPPLLLVVLMFISLVFTKLDQMNTSHYDSVRHEILLYQSTRDLLDCLHYNMSFSETEGASLNIGASYQGFGMNFGRSKKKKLTKAMQPFTLQSLVDEYKRYVQEVRNYISKALEESGYSKKKRESFSKILICIDELDKVLDPNRLHDMLKSLKSIFELEGVYYILSISEDALESYELRGLQTKNEIDSTFTHVFKLPPMEVDQCREFYIQKKIKDNIVPLAIVNGGGVPRDMERISDLIQLNSNQRMSPEDYRVYFENLEVKGIIQKIRNHPRLAPIQKKEFEDGVHQIMESKVSIDQVVNLIKEKRFLECYPCSPEEGRKDYCNLLGLLQAFSVKAEINQLIGEWMKFYDSLGKGQWWSKYKEGVDHLRQAVYLLGESPFAAKEELEKAKEIQS